MSISLPVMGGINNKVPGPVLEEGGHSNYGLLGGLELLEGGLLSDFHHVLLLLPAIAN